MPHAITEIAAPTPEQFRNEIIPRGKPIVIRGLVRDWPIVQYAKQSPLAFCQYLMQFDRGQEFNTAIGPSSTEGRIFYNSDMSGLNCRFEQKKLEASLRFLLDNINENPAPLLAIQSIQVPRFLAGLERELPMPLVPVNTEPRIWIGGKTTVAAHYDPSENIACCIAGRRQFTLFPTEQVGNLYIGPFEFTPSGTTVSMVNFDKPDYEKFPRYKEAEDAAYTALLEPGDAIYIPYLWWHHVKALDGINALMNYWWNGKQKNAGTDPSLTLLLGMLSVRDLPKHQREAWQKLFEFYIFSEQQSAEHIQTLRQGILGNTNEDKSASLKQTIIKALSRTI
ncbi:MAG: cupin-like domain-containing protein [Gammaproteobacteria bacterium]|nr:MAG: cupin-like domain-containing protein [Gammaproteobacteria bacterium]